jgi:endonuclease IV
LLPKLREHQVTLCVENSPGTANGMMMPSLTELVDFMQSIAGTEMSQYVKICCDTQHAWANGESILHTDPIFQAAVLKHCAVVHFNGNPGTNLGAHKDRHSQNTLMETTGYGEEFYKSFLKQALGLPESTRPPFIFERGYVATEDLKQATTLLESL